jgi:hypothetical protein
MYSRAEHSDHPHPRVPDPRNAELTESVGRALDINEHMSREEEIHRLHEAIAALDVDKAIILLHLRITITMKLPPSPVSPEPT